MNTDTDIEVVIGEQKGFVSLSRRGSGQIVDEMLKSVA